MSIEQAQSRHGNSKGARFTASFFALDCYSHVLSDELPPVLLETPFDVVSMQFCMHYAFESVEKAHAKLSFNERVGQILGVTRQPTRMDSQAKYCSIARGDGAVYLRMPTGTAYREKIWVRDLRSLLTRSL